jgi:hypothetical protein
MSSSARTRRLPVGFYVILLLTAPLALGAQHMGHGAKPMDGTTGPLGLSMNRNGSGTAWVPDSTRMYAGHFMTGSWMWMAHGTIFGQYIDQGGDRGDDQFGSINWGMLMGSRPLAGGQLTLRTMLSLDPWTVGKSGYPLLLQTGESYRGQPLHDRQHPHDLFMELAAVYEHEITRSLALSLYVAPSGEPASGPVAFMHRPSAANDPLAPIAHHWQDATHITFGVITAGLFTRTLKLEGSVFNGQEPDEIRSNFDFEGNKLDSYAGRITFNPNGAWSFAASYAALETPEELHPEISIHRLSASALHECALGHSHLSAALVYGGNRPSDTKEIAYSLLGELNLEMGRNVVFGRAEMVEKTGEELVLPDEATHHELFRVGAISLGYVREILTGKTGMVGLGARGTVNFVPDGLQDVYGSRNPLGAVVFLRLRPPASGGMSH